MARVGCHVWAQGVLNGGEYTNVIEDIHLYSYWKLESVAEILSEWHNETTALLNTLGVVSARLNLGGRGPRMRVGVEGFQ